jgi:hypothetical protein
VDQQPGSNKGSGPSGRLAARLGNGLMVSVSRWTRRPRQCRNGRCAGCSIRTTDVRSGFLPTCPWVVLAAITISVAAQGGRMHRSPATRQAAAIRPSAQAVFWLRCSGPPYR